jgi:hypothetical protein
MEQKHKKKKIANHKAKAQRNNLKIPFKNNLNNK